MTSVLNILEDYCLYRKYKYCRIDGETMIEDREAQIEAFTDPNSDHFVFLLSTRAGGLGINLATADTVILYDSDWNPQVDLQAMDRAHRIGQTKPVNVYRMISENTIEEKIIERQLIKLKWDSLVIQKGRIAQKGKGMNKEELEGLITHGASEIFKASKGTFTEEDIDDLLKRGEERTKIQNEQLDSEIKKKTEKISDLGINSINIYEFEGDNYLDRHKKDKEAINTAKVTSISAQQSSRRAGKPEFPFQSEKKVIKLLEYHLFEEKEKLLELLNKENEFKHNANIFRENRLSVPESLERLSNEDEIEKQRLLDLAFTNWTKNDYYAFIRGNEKYGRTNFKKITDKVKTKTIDEVKTYSARFWKLIDTLEDGDKIKLQIEKGEELIEQRRAYALLLENKCNGVEFFEDLLFNKQIYTKFRSKLFTAAHDKYLVWISAKLGYGNWARIREEIKKVPDFAFDHYFKSRTEGDLNKRMNSLIKVITNEIELETASQQKARTSSRRKPQDPSKKDTTDDQDGSVLKKRVPKEEKSMEDFLQSEN